jgi:hypothetical protein
MNDLKRISSIHRVWGVPRDFYQLMQFQLRLIFCHPVLVVSEVWEVTMLWRSA